MNNQRQDEERFYSDMGFRLKQIRQTKKVSQEDLADALGMVRQTIQKYESGEIRMSPEIIHNCATVFKIPVGYFYGEGHNYQKYTKTSLMIASEIMMLPSEDMQKSIYTLIKNINIVWEQDNKKQP